MLYAEYRAAERAGVKPPGIDSDSWDELDALQQMHLICYNQIRCIEEAEEGL